MKKKRNTAVRSSGMVRRIRWGKVRSSRNSYSATAKLSQLDWGEWWADGGLLVPGTYLHVPRRDDETVHRVFCRHSDNARLGWRSGELWWVYSPNDARSAAGSAEQAPQAGEARAPSLFAASPGSGNPAPDPNAEGQTL